jgi:hypothetical protein
VSSSAGNRSPFLRDKLTARSDELLEEEELRPVVKETKKKRKRKNPVSANLTGTRYDIGEHEAPFLSRIFAYLTITSKTFAVFENRCSNCTLIINFMRIPVRQMVDNVGFTIFRNEDPMA